MNTVSNTQHNIKNRDTPNDVIYTPKALVKLHIGEVSDYVEDNYSKSKKFHILDPCAGERAYYKRFKNTYGYGLDTDFVEKIKFEENEITQGKDFFKNENVGKYDMIIGNLPFSLTGRFLKKSVELQPTVISYLMPIYGLTPARMEFMEENGYKLAKIKQFKWYVCMGMCAFCTWVNEDYGPDDKVEVTYDRTVWYKVDVWAEKKAKQKAREEKKAKKGKKN